MKINTRLHLYLLVCTWKSVLWRNCCVLWGGSGCVCIQWVPVLRTHSDMVMATMLCVHTGRCSTHTAFIFHPHKYSTSQSTRNYFHFTKMKTEVQSGKHISPQSGGRARLELWCWQSGSTYFAWKKCGLRLGRPRGPFASFLFHCQAMTVFCTALAVRWPKATGRAGPHVWLLSQQRVVAPNSARRPLPPDPLYRSLEWNDLEPHISFSLNSQSFNIGY